MKSDLLAGTRAVDLTGRDAWDCGRFLASLGVEVIRVDLPGATIDDDWRFGQADKLCLSIDYESDAGRVVLRELLANSDMVVESFAPGRMAELGLGYQSLRTDNPDLVKVSVTPFGQSGPWAAYRGEELVVAALSGVMSVNGYADRTPLKEPGHALRFHACLAGAMGGIFALYQARRGGGGQEVDVSVQELAATRNTTWLMKHQFDGEAPRRLGPFLHTGMGPNRMIWALRDGYAISPMGGPGSPVHMAIAGWMADLGYPNPYDGVVIEPGRPDPAFVQRWAAALEAFLRDRTRAELMDEGLRRKAYILPVREPRDIADDAQFAARGFFAPVEGVSDSLLFPQWFVLTDRMSDAPVRLPDQPRAPEASPALLASAARPKAKPHAGASALPLAGVKVLDFSWAIVGNTAAKVMGDLGAEVIKIESAKRLAIERTAPVVKNAPWEKTPNASPWFAHIATSKRSFQIDLSHPDARPVIEALVDWADIVLENFSPGVMDRLGLGYEALKARKLSIIMGSGSIFGQTGPMGSLPGTDLTGAAWSGRVAMTGDTDRGPILPSATYGDSVTPYALNAGLVAALLRRDETGEGCRIDAAMIEILAQQMLPFILRAERDRKHGGDGRIERTGNRSPTHAPHNVFPSRGDDAWVAIAVTSDDEFAALCQVMGRPEYAEDERFRTAEARKANEAALEDIVAAFTRTLDPWEAMDRLQARGVPAGAVQRPGDVADRDPQLKHRGYLQVVEHPVLGAFPHQRSPLSFSGAAPLMSAAPGLGEHTHAICRDVLGLSEAQYRRLEANGVFR